MSKFNLFFCFIWNISLHISFSLTCDRCCCMPKSGICLARMNIPHNDIATYVGGNTLQLTGTWAAGKEISRRSPTYLDLIKHFKIKQTNIVYFCDLIFWVKIFWDYLLIFSLKILPDLWPLCVVPKFEKFPSVEHQEKPKLNGSQKQSIHFHSYGI